MVTVDIVTSSYGHREADSWLKQRSSVNAVADPGASASHVGAASSSSGQQSSDVVSTYAVNALDTPSTYWCFGVRAGPREQINVGSLQFNDNADWLLLGSTCMINACPKASGVFRQMQLNSNLLSAYIIF